MKTSQYTAMSTVMDKVTIIFEFQFYFEGRKHTLDKNNFSKGKFEASRDLWGNINWEE